MLRQHWALLSRRQCHLTSMLSEQVISQLYNYSYGWMVLRFCLPRPVFSTPKNVSCVSCTCVEVACRLKRAPRVLLNNSAPPGGLGGGGEQGDHEVQHCSNHQMRRTPSKPSANQPPPPATRCPRTPQGRGLCPARREVPATATGL